MAKGPVKTDAEKILRGKFGKEPVPQSSLKRKAPKCPPYLNEEAKKGYRKLAPKLERMGLLTELDGDSFSFVMWLRSAIIKVAEFLNDENQSFMQIVYKPDPDGGMHEEAKQSPYVVLMRQLLEQYRKQASDFGLTPRGRTGLTLKGKKDDDGFGDLLD